MKKIITYSKFLLIVILVTVSMKEFAAGQCANNIACTGEYNPVCAKQDTFYRTFSNRCRLNRENMCAETQWEFVRVGQCE
uniref:Secreted Kazal protein n=1 Tax=Pristhesancus plagipennis TaxID=1955184 RepID=A0A2K8JPE6_PRIPG|nr:secreted Kazal protein [Pristhesancus plagipennis]